MNSDGNNHFFDPDKVAQTFTCDWPRGTEVTVYCRQADYQQAKATIEREWGYRVTGFVDTGYWMRDVIGEGEFTMMRRQDSAWWQPRCDTAIGARWSLLGSPLLYDPDRRLRRPKDI